MKCHISVDAGSGLVHSIQVTSANVHDVTVAAQLIRKDDEVVYGDSAYLGLQKREEVSTDAHLAQVEYRINRRPHSLPKVSDNAIDWEQVIGAVQGRARISYHQESVWVSQNSLPRACQKRQQALCAIWVRKPAGLCQSR